MRGAVWDGSDLHLVDDLDVRPPGPGEATVRVLASGICHTDLRVLDGGGGPVVLGHEGAGVVDAVGPGVDVAVGTRVVIQADTSRREHLTFTWRGHPVRAYAGVASWAERTTVDAARLMPTGSLDLAPAALVGCAASTGWGVVNNVTHVTAGQSVAVLGVGGIGVNAIAAARLAGADVLAVDIDPAKEAMARSFGASRFAPALDTPVDVAIECSGAPPAIESALRYARTTALVGLPPDGYRAPLDVGRLLADGKVLGSYNGNVTIADLRTIIGLAGELRLADQVSHVWPLAELRDAIAAARAGGIVRAVLDLS